jgi:class 3 adenylate cyclase
MNRGAFDFLVKPIDFKDLEVTIDKTIKHARDVRRTVRSTEENSILRMFVNTGIVEKLLPMIRTADASPSESIDATVAFVNVCDFGAVAASTPPDQALRMLNANFEIILPEVTARGGVIDKFVGDAVMAVFRGDDHVRRAVDSCVAARSDLADLSQKSGAGSAYALGIGVGIDTGPMISGSIGSKVVSRLDYTVLGEVVNRAALLQSRAGKGEILVSAAVQRAVADAFDTKPAEGAALEAGKSDDAPAFAVGKKLEPDAPMSAAETVLMDRDEMESIASDGG